jgi:DNA polymerase-1
MEPVCSVPQAERGPLFLLDGNNIAYRAFFALPQDISTSDGLPTNALYGFCAMVIKILADYHPGAVIVAWDSPQKTFRHGEFEDYKAQRKPMPDLLSQQWPYLPQVSEAFGFVNLSVPGFEADDILATLARQAEAEGRETFIVTGDRDALQLAGRHVSIMANTRGVTEVKIYDPAAVEERFGVPPRLIPDLIGLKGDTSDNIPGIPGIGEKTAAQLLQQFGDLDGVLSHIDQVAGPKRQELLRENQELALLSRRLARLDRDAPIDMHTAELLPHQLQREKLEELYERLQFHTLLDRVAALQPVPASAPTERVGAPLPAARAWPADETAARGLFDWSRPVGAAAGSATQSGDGGGAGDDAVWLAQAPADGGDDYGRFVVARVGEDQLGSPTLAGLLESSGAVCHDLKSSPALHRVVRRAAHDTYVAAYLLAPGKRGYRLVDLAQEAGIALPECGPSEPAAAGATTTAETAGPAGGAEAALALPVAARQEQALREQGMWELFQEIELPLTRVLIEMQSAGIYLDCYRLGEITGKIEDQMDGLEALIHELAGETFNLSSPQQLGRVLFEGLGLPHQRKTKTGYSTDAKTLESLRSHHPIVEHLITHRELSKLMSTYLLSLPQAVDPDSGRLHTTFHQTVAATGRLSSSDPNLQNIPVRRDLGAQIRQCFSAEPGNLLVVADYSQIELHVMAHLSGEPALLEALARGEDIHCRTAAEVFGMPADQVDTVHRRYAKAVNFGIMYGISAFGLSQNLGIEREEAAAYIQRYFERLPRVRAFIEATIATARIQGYATTVFGRRRPIPELASGNFQERSLGERLAVNSVIQGSAADMIKVAMIRCQDRLSRDFPGSRLVLQVHDELVFEAAEADAYAVRDAMVKEMVGAYPMEPPLRVDAGVGPDWLAAK